jgi:hypothetical protein
MNNTATPEMNETDIKLICTDSLTASITSQLVVWNNLVFGLFNLFLTVSTIALNSATIIAYINSKLLKERMAYFMIMMLSVNDLFVGLISNSLYVALLLKEYSSRMTDCLLVEIQVYCLYFLSGCSFKTMVVMSWERYAAICHPLFHRTKVTRKRLTKCLAFLWLLSLVIAIVSRRFPAFFEFLIVPELIGFSILLVYFYSRIYLASSRSSKNVLRNGGKQDSAVDTAKKDQQRRVSLNVRLAKSCSLAVITYVVCYLPSCIVTNRQFFSFEKDLQRAVNVWAVTLIFANSSINSLVFFWRSASLRNEVYVVFKPLFCRKNHVEREGNEATQMSSVESSVYIES